MRPTFEQASRMAVISAWAVISVDANTRLCSTAMTVPPRLMAQPNGLCPCWMPRRAAATACRMRASMSPLVALFIRSLVKTGDTATERLDVLPDLVVIGGRLAVGRLAGGELQVMRQVTECG